MQDLLTLDDTRATAALDAAVLDTARARGDVNLRPAVMDWLSRQEI